MITMQKKKKLNYENFTVSRFWVITLLLGIGFLLVLPQTLPRGNSDFEADTVLDRVREPSIISKNDIYRAPVAATPTDFVSRWDTTLTSSGSSIADQIRLPLEDSGTYNFMVDWGDGTSAHIITSNYSAAIHTYASAG